VTRRYRIEWAPVAVQDLEDIVDYVAAREAPSAAASIFDKIKSRTLTLTRHPTRCRIVPELKDFGITEYRELIVPPYRVFFRVTADVVGIVGVLDGRRDLEETLLQTALR